MTLSDPHYSTVITTTSICQELCHFANCGSHDVSLDQYDVSVVDEHSVGPKQYYELFWGSFILVIFLIALSDDLLSPIILELRKNHVYFKGPS